MRNVRSSKFCPGTREELLPGLTPDFPYIASHAELDYYAGGVVPWHWHKEVELFYMESGSLEYYTPKGKEVFPAGSGGFVNSNVLHMTKTVSKAEENVQLLHIFDPSFLSGEQGSRIEQLYFTPILAAPQIEVFMLSPAEPRQAETLRLIQSAFLLPEEEFGYEFKLRELLSNIWLLLFELLRPQLEHGMKYDSDKNSERLKLMMVFVREHFAEKFSISSLASAAFLSERECFRVFQKNLHMTPAEYVKSIRLHEACKLLAKTQRPVTEIFHACGFGSSSYFGKAFREQMHCTPIEYRKKWQNSEVEQNG